MLRVIMPGVALMNVTNNYFMLNVVLLNFIMLSIIMLNVIMLNVVTPLLTYTYSYITFLCH